MSRSAPAGQMNLLDWRPPQPVARFADDQVRAVSVSEQVSRAVSAALKDSPLPREAIAKRMAEFLGQSCSVSMLNAYASQARDEHNISTVRFVALVHATQDRRLVELLAGMFGWTVIERKFLKLIELAAIQDKEDELRRQRQALTRAAKIEGMLG